MSRPRQVPPPFFSLCIAHVSRWSESICFKYCDLSPAEMGRKQLPTASEKMLSTRVEDVFHEGDILHFNVVFHGLLQYLSELRRAGAVKHPLVGDAGKDKFDLNQTLDASHAHRSYRNSSSSSSFVVLVLALS